jgi:hypothetical protein
MSDEAKKAADRLEQALAENEKRKAAAAALHAEQAPERARLAALRALAEALPEPERRKVLDAAGVRRISSAPPPPTPIGHGGSYISEPRSIPARWPVWRALPHAQLWQAVALSLNLEPIQAMLDQVGRYPLRHARPDVPAEFLDRLAVCQRALSMAGPIKPQGPLCRGMLQSPLCDVLVAEVAAFLVLAEFSVPDEMRQTTPPVAESADTEPVPNEPKTDRQDRRLRACEAAGLKMPTSSVGRLPDGIAKVAAAEGVSRQAFSDEVRAALKRREQDRRDGVTRHSIE